MAELLKGKPVADAMKAELIKKVEDLKTKGLAPKLGIIRVGARPDDLFYEGGAKKTAAAARQAKANTSAARQSPLGHFQTATSANTSRTSVST